MAVEPHPLPDAGRPLDAIIRGMTERLVVPKNMLDTSQICPNDRLGLARLRYSAGRLPCSRSRPPWHYLALADTHYAYLHQTVHVGKDSFLLVKKSHIVALIVQGRLGGVAPHYSHYSSVVSHVAGTDICGK